MRSEKIFKYEEKREKIMQMIEHVVQLLVEICIDNIQNKFYGYILNILEAIMILISCLKSKF